MFMVGWRHGFFSDFQNENYGIQWLLDFLFFIGFLAGERQKKVSEHAYTPTVLDR